METKTTAVATAAKEAKVFFAREDVKNKFTEILGKRGNAFTSSVLTLINQSEKLAKCNPQSVYMCAMMAATLDLPVNSNLGFAYIIPYGNEAQFQMGYKGFIQLAMRSGQFKTISSAPIFKGQLIRQNPLTGFEFDFDVLPADAKEEPIGYAAYIELTNGFRKTLYLTKEEVTAHGRKYSKTFNNGPWKTDFESMALKTVLKMLLSKYAPLSVEMMQAVIVDQSVIKDVDTLEIKYPDAGNAEVNSEDLLYLYDMKKAALIPDEVANIERILDIKGGGVNAEKESYAKVHELLQSK